MMQIETTVNPEHMEIVEGVVARAITDGRITVHFQAQWSLRGGRKKRSIKSAEALGRVIMTPDESGKLGRTPDDNVLLPGEWIPAAQTLGEMGKVNALLIGQACAF